MERWARLDLDYFEHPRVRSASRDAVLLHLSSILWSARMMTDGRLDDAAALPGWRLIKYPGAAIRSAVEAGLWVPEGDGWVIHDYLDYQTSRAQREQVRDQARERQRRRRKNGGNGNGDGHVTP